MTFKWLQLFFNPVNRDLRHVYLRRNGIPSKTVFRTTKHLCFSTITSQHKFDLLKFVPRQCKITEKVENSTKVIAETYITSTFKKRRSYTVTAGYAAKRRSKRFPFYQMWKEWIPDDCEAPAKCTQARGMSKKAPSKSDHTESTKLRRDVNKKNEYIPAASRKGTKSRYGLWTNATARALCSRDKLRTKSENTFQVVETQPTKSEKPKRFREKGKKYSTYHLKVNPHTGKLDIDEFYYEDVLIKRAKNYIDNGGQIRDFPWFINEALKSEGRSKYHKVIHNYDKKVYLPGTTICNRFSVHKSRPVAGSSNYHSRGLKSCDSKVALNDEKYSLKRLRACQAKHCLTNLPESAEEEENPPPEVHNPSCKWKSKNRVVTKYMTEEDAYRQASTFLIQFSRPGDDPNHILPKEKEKVKVSVKTKTLTGHYPSREPMRKGKDVAYFMSPRARRNGGDEGGGTKGSLPPNPSSSKGTSGAWFANLNGAKAADVNSKKPSKISNNPKTLVDSSYVTNTNKIYKKKEYTLSDARDDANHCSRGSLLTNVINILPPKRNIANLVQNRPSFGVDLRNVDTINNIDLSSKHSSVISTSLPKMKRARHTNSVGLNPGDPEIATRSNIDVPPATKPAAFMRSYIPVLRRRRIKYSKVDTKRGDLKQHGRKLYNLQENPNTEGENTFCNNNPEAIEDAQSQKKCDECGENMSVTQVQSNVNNNTQPNDKPLQKLTSSYFSTIAPKLNKTWNMDQAITNRRPTNKERWMQPPEKDNLVLNTRTFMTTPARCFSSATDELLNICKYCGTVHNNDGAGCPMKEAIKLFKLEEKQPVPFKLITMPSIIKTSVTKVNKNKDNSFVPFPISKRVSRNQIQYEKPLIALTRKGTEARLRAPFKDQPRLNSYSTFKTIQKEKRAKQQNMQKFKQNLRKLLGDLLQDCNQSFRWSKNVKIVQGKMQFVIQEGNKRVNLNIPCGQANPEPQKLQNSECDKRKAVQANTESLSKSVHGSREHSKVRKYSNSRRFLHQEYNNTTSDKQDDKSPRKHILSKKKSGTRQYNTCCRHANLELAKIEHGDDKRVISNEPKFNNPQAEESYRKYKAMLEISKKSSLKQTAENSEISLDRKVNNILIQIPRNCDGNNDKIQRVKCNIIQHTHEENMGRNNEIIELFPRKTVKEIIESNFSRNEEHQRCPHFNRSAPSTRNQTKPEHKLQCVACDNKPEFSKIDPEESKLMNKHSFAKSVRSRSLSRPPRSVIIKTRNHSHNESRNESKTSHHDHGINNNEAVKTKEKLHADSKRKKAIADDKSGSTIRTFEYEKNDILIAKNGRKEQITPGKQMELRTVDRGKILMPLKDDKKRKNTNQIVKNVLSSKQLNDFSRAATLSTQTNYSTQHMFVPSSRFFTSQSTNNFQHFKKDCPPKPSVEEKCCPKFCYKESSSKMTSRRKSPETKEEEDCEQEVPKCAPRERKLCAKTDDFKAVLTETLHLPDCCEIDHIQSKLKRYNKRLNQQKLNQKFYNNYKCGAHASNSEIMMPEKKIVLPIKESCEDVRDKRTLMDFISGATAKIHEFIKPSRKSSDGQKSCSDVNIEPGKQLECKPNLRNLRRKPSAHSADCMRGRTSKSRERRRRARSRNRKNEETDSKYKVCIVEAKLADKKIRRDKSVKSAASATKKSRSESGICDSPMPCEEDGQKAQKICKDGTWARRSSNVGKNIYAIKADDDDKHKDGNSKSILKKLSATNANYVGDKHQKYYDGPKYFKVCRDVKDKTSRAASPRDDDELCRKHRERRGDSKMKLCKKYSDANIHAAKSGKDVKMRKLCADWIEAHGSAVDKKKLRREKMKAKRFLEQATDQNYNVAINKQDFESRLHNKYNADKRSSNVILETVEPTHYRVRSANKGFHDEPLIFGNGPACPPTVMKPICDSKLCYLDPNESRQCPIGNEPERSYESKHASSPKFKNHKKVCTQSCVAKSTHHADAKSSRCSTLSTVRQSENEETSYLSQKQMDIICQKVIDELQCRRQLKLFSDDISINSTVTLESPSFESQPKWSEDVQNCVRKCLDANLSSKASLIVTKTCETSIQLSQCLHNVCTCLNEYRKCLEEFDKIPKLGSVLSVPSLASQDGCQDCADNSLNKPRVSQSHTGIGNSSCSRIKFSKECKSPSMDKIDSKGCPRHFHVCADSDNIANESANQNQKCLPGTYLADRDVLVAKTLPKDIMVQEPIVNSCKHPTRINCPSHPLKRNEPDIGSIGRNFGNRIESCKYRQHCLQKINDIITNNIRTRDSEVKTNDSKNVENTGNNRAAICLSPQELQKQLQLTQEGNDEICEAGLAKEASQLGKFEINLTSAYPLSYTQLPVPTVYDQGPSCSTPRNLPYIPTKRTLIANRGTRCESIYGDHGDKESTNFIDKKEWNSKTKSAGKSSMKDIVFHRPENEKLMVRKETLASNNPQYEYCHLNGSSKMKNNKIGTLFDGDTSSRLV